MPTDKQPRRFKLLKDLPITLAGTIFIPKETGSSTYKPENGGWLEEVPEELVTGCPLWFEEVKEQPLPERIEVTKMVRVKQTNLGGNEPHLHIFFNEWPKLDDHEKIKQAIEFILNGCSVEDLKNIEIGKQILGSNPDQERQITYWKEQASIHEGNYKMAVSQLRELRKSFGNISVDEQEYADNQFKRCQEYVSGNDKETSHLFRGGYHNQPQPTPPPTVVEDKVVTNNDDVECLSLRDIEHISLHITQDGMDFLRRKVKEKLKQ